MSSVAGVGRLCRLIASTVSARFKEDTSLLASIRGRGSETARHWRQPPFLNIGFYENESALPEIDVHAARPVCADRGKEILGFEAVGDVVKLFAVAGEEDGARSRTVANANNITLDIFGGVVCRLEGLVEAAMAGGGVGQGGFVPACDGQSKIRS